MVYNKIMKGFKANIEVLTESNTFFRQVLHTSKHFQLVVMSLKPNEEIGFEIHEENDQFFRFESGIGKVVIDERNSDVKAGDAVVIPAGAKHNILNVSDSEYLKFYTIYGPPHHKDKTVHKTKEEALSDNEEFDGVTSE